MSSKAHGKLRVDAVCGGFHHPNFAQKLVLERVKPRRAFARRRVGLFLFDQPFFFQLGQSSGERITVYLADFTYVCRRHRHLPDVEHEQPEQQRLLELRRLRCLRRRLARGNNFDGGRGKIAQVLELEGWG